ncbi:winged helix-turn-helix transcriptional regulator [Micromonospora sp. WMMD1102]|uniref:winged helix-turn-helix transcriptional regulator n=1 Tax=Micromonospora sp. WMMD1102 TaxID=3016105 RepID=UPI0024150378|nr:winged helix-turn-helix transcriptional regulator [Micromonospora sp. WMMD1102]MDG4786470.1 winged helix-turn-helix transcriptional regulator [Micromonospora sp. WMMD1102]
MGWEWMERDGLDAGSGAGLSLHRIVRVAVGLADADGLASLSMRRVAAALDTGAMSLYRYVPGRAELVDLMVESVFGEIDYPAVGPAGWRARIELSARREWAMYQRHPWVLPVVAGTSRPPLGPNLLANVEWVLGALDGFGLDPATMLQLYLTVSDYVQGAARYAQTEAEQERRSGTSIEQWWAVEVAGLGERLGTGRFPLLSRLVGQAGAGPAAVRPDFEFGLARVLDGVAVFLAGGSAPADPPAEQVATRKIKFEKVTASTDLTDVPGRQLPADTSAALELLGRRWTLDLLYVLSHGEARFRDLVEALPGVSRRVLTERLRELAGAGMLHRRVDPGPPTRIDYALTERGAGLHDVLAGLYAWAGQGAPTAIR